MSDRINHLLDEVAAAEKRVQYAMQNLQDALIDESPYKVGDVMEAMKFDRKLLKSVWVPVRVEDYQFLGQSMVYKVAFKTKAGEWSKVLQQVWPRRLRLPQGSDSTPTAAEGGVSE